MEPEQASDPQRRSTMSRSLRLSPDFMSRREGKSRETWTEMGNILGCMMDLACLHSFAYTAVQYTAAEVPGIRPLWNSVTTDFFVRIESRMCFAVQGKQVRRGRDHTLWFCCETLRDYLTLSKSYNEYCEKKSTCRATAEKSEQFSDGLLMWSRVRPPDVHV